jgi:DNA-binding GntR family transcriptional regulator
VNGEAVYVELERQIILGHLKPRERLVESELCKRLGISRTLLREVFRRLEGAGLVSFQPNRGVVVRDFTPQEVEDVYFLRTVLERAAVPLILQRVTPADMKALRRLQKDFENVCGGNDMEAMILTNMAFHRRLSQISGNQFLCQFLEISRVQTHQIRYLAWLDERRVQESIRGHREILAALAQRNANRFERAVLAHLEAGRGDYRRIFPVGAERQHALPGKRTRGHLARGGSAQGGRSWAAN